MPDAVPKLNIFAYADYRKYLSDAYQARKSFDPGFSQRFIAQKVRGSSAGWFSDIVKGRSNLSGRHMIPLVKLLRLDEREAAYFEALVRYDQAGSAEERNLHYQRLIALKGVKPELVGKDQFEFYGAWYHGVIREMLFFRPFAGDYAALARSLRPPIRALQARDSIRLLERLGFIRRGPDGVCRAVAATLKKDPAFRTLNVQNFLRTNMALAMDSLERFPKEERDISTLTLSLSEAGFAKAREELRSLRERLLALMQADPDPDKVFQCNLHLFPVTN